MCDAYCCSPSHGTNAFHPACVTAVSITTKASDEIMLYADAISYDEWMNSKDINWISDDIEATNRKTSYGNS